MFLDYLSSIEEKQKQFLEIIKNSTENDVIDVLEDNRNISWSDFAVLLSDIAREKFLVEIAELATKKTIERFGRVIKLYVPLYLSNYCTNGCLYCNFNAVNKIDRIFLTKEQVKEEIEALYEKGFKNLLFVAGEDKKHITIDYLAEIIKEAKKYMAAVSVEVAPMEYDEYLYLVSNGLDGTTIYQETYHKETYLKLHRGTKQNYEKRLEYVENAAKAGVRRIGVGALLGLYDPIYEALYLFEHIKYLYKTYWYVNISLSFPRIRPIKGGFTPLYNVSDKLLVQLISAFRIAFYDLDLILSTRETPYFRDNMALVGINVMSAESKTTVGGYKREYIKSEDGQFEVADNRSAHEIVESLKEKDIEAVWKDWEGVMYGR